MKIAMVGGTFDPPHLGHTLFANELIHALSLDQVWLVPAAVPPHKRGRVQATAAQRLEMTRRACEGSERILVSDVELRRTGTSYTVDTVMELARRNPDAMLHLVIGSDWANKFTRWHRAEEILRHARVVLAERAGYPALSEKPSWAYAQVRTPLIEISSTEIRRRLAEDEPVRHWLSPTVHDFIVKMGLYRTDVS